METKKQFKWFTIFDYEKEQDYLREMHKYGWEYLQDFFGYSYFRKPVDENGMEDEIFCDEESRFQMMQRVIKGRMLPLLIIFFAVLLPQIVMSLSNGYGYVVDALIGFVFGLYLTIFAICLVKYVKYKSRRR